MIYVHVPFCRSFCTYCGFYSEICSRREPQQVQNRVFSAYTDALLDEIRSHGISTEYMGLEDVGFADPTLKGPPSYHAEGGRVAGGILTTSSLNLPIGLESHSVIEVSRAVYDKVAYRGGTEGVIAEVYSKENSLDSLELGENPLVIVLEGVEKPGNLGAVLRSADAAGADAVLICDPLTDIYNPNLVRASIGAVFTQQIACCASADAIKFLKEKGIRIYTAQLQDSEWYYDTDMRCGTAIAIGTEATGLTDQWREAADAHIKIPMLGRLDSLNASVSAAILLYEAVRQRNSNR